VTSIAGYLQERARLARLQQMPADEARRFYEAVRSRQERRLVGFVAVLVVAAAAALGRLWWKANGG
jgi:ferric-dicitrate binding protein FerR (iron transport regulator)